MLEESIKELTQAVKSLTIVLTHLRTHELQGHNPQADDLGVTKTETIIPETEVPKVAATPTRDDLQALCLRLSKEKKADKAKIQAIMQPFGGTLLKDVPDDKLAALAIALQELDQ